MPSLVEFAVVVFLALIVFWIYQLVQVVSMDDKDFKGRNDKLIFFMIVFFGSVPGAFGFYLWRHFRVLNRKPEAHLEAAFKQFMKEHQRDFQKENHAE